MNNYRFAFLCLTAISVGFFGCNNKRDEKRIKPAIKFFTEGRFLIKVSYDSTGNIVAKQSFDKDTTPDGAYTEYFKNGTIGSWRWFRRGQKDPICGVFYYEDGWFDTMKGRPFLEMGWDEINQPVVVLVNPPHLKIQLGYKEIYKNRILRNITYDPILTDSICWVPLDKYKYRIGREYKIYFYIVDTLHQAFLYQDSTHLAQR